MNGIHEVSGSIPLGSTIHPAKGGLLSRAEAPAAPGERESAASKILQNWSEPHLRPSPT